MKPIEFPDQNCIYAKDQPEYIPLPVFKDQGPEGICISCWNLSFIERLKILFTGKIWLSIFTFHKPLSPHRLSVNQSELMVTSKQAQKALDNAKRNSI